VPTFSLMRMEVETFEAGDLPGDLKKIPAIHPGGK